MDGITTTPAGTTVDQALTRTAFWHLSITALARSR
jgi:hypothetical protein